MEFVIMKVSKYNRELLSSRLVVILLGFGSSVSSNVAEFTNSKSINEAVMSGKNKMLLMLFVLGALTFIGCDDSSSTTGDTSEITDTTPTKSSYSIVTTGQTKTYNATEEIVTPSAGQAFYGQDAQFSVVQPSYTKSDDGLTVKDNITGLTWQQDYDNSAVYWTDAKAVPAVLNAQNYGGYSDWRLPTIKELYSLWNGSTGWPFIDAETFPISYASQDDLSHAIFWSATKYVGLLQSTEDASSGADVGTGVEMAFGINFGTGHIKAYSLNVGPKHLLRCVRGDIYGVNNFKDNSDGAITDSATGLMWSQADSGVGMDWEHALAFAQSQNAANFLGHNDWRLPNTKELQNIVDYTRSPGATDRTQVGPAINQLFNCTEITNEAGDVDYPWYWTSTTNPGLPSNTIYDTAWYVAFGMAVGSDGKDLHGAGAVRFDGKVQGELVGQSRYLNYVRLVRNTK